MKKSWLIGGIILVLIVGFVIVQNNKKPTSTPGGSEQVVVTVNNGPKETDKLAVQRLKEEIARFNKVYPDIKIRWTDRPYSPDSFSTSMAGGTAEDVIGLWATEGYVAERGYALDLTELVEGWEYKSQLNMDVLKPFIRDQRIYALPSDGYIMGLMYNKSFLKKAGLEPPTNWDEFTQCAKVLTDKQKGIAGFGIMGNGAEAGWGFLNWSGKQGAILK
jgi:multiple sugar transport system substrate-binding protein